MALTKDRGRINVRGGGLFKVKQLASGGADTTMDPLGYLTSVEVQREPNMVDSIDDAGDLILRSHGGTILRLVAQLKQTSAEEIALMDGAADKVWHSYYQVKLQNPTLTYQEWYIPLMVMDPGFTLMYQAATERIIEVTMTALMPKGAVTVTPAGLSVPAGSLWTLVDTATTPLGEVTTATGTIYAAAF